MNYPRRGFLSEMVKAGVTGGVSLLLHSLPRASHAAEGDRPSPGTLQAGDLLWPKPKGKIVPYEGKAADPANERSLWDNEKNEFIDKYLNAPNVSAEEMEAARQLYQMNYEAFRSRYLADEEPGEEKPFFSIGPFYVGHVALVFLKDGAPWIVEAVRPKVRTISYDAWLQEPGADTVWHGRIVGEKADRRLSVAQEGLKYKDREYAFFKFNLDDETGLYCSKLVWLAVYRALGWAIDDNPKPFRWPWYSPKQLMRSRHICLVLNPGHYTGNTTACS